MEENGGRQVLMAPTHYSYSSNLSYNIQQAPPLVDREPASRTKVEPLSVCRVSDVEPSLEMIPS